MGGVCLWVLSAVCLWVQGGVDFLGRHPPGRHTPPGRHPLGRHPPPETATTVDGMHSCYRPQRSWGKVIFSQASVSHSVHRGGCLSQCLLGYTPPLGRYTPWQVHPPWQVPLWAGTPQQVHPLAGIPPRQVYPSRQVQPPRPPPHDGHCSGRCASYWNAFLLIRMFSIKSVILLILETLSAHSLFFYNGFMFIINYCMFTVCSVMPHIYF